MTNLILALRAYKSDVDIHKHSAYQIVLSEDEPFNTVCENKNHINIYGFAIKPQVAHSCQCSNSNLVILNIEPYSTLGNILSKEIGEKRRSVHFTSQQEISDFFPDSPAPPQSPPAFILWVTDIFLLENSATPPRPAALPARGPVCSRDLQSGGIVSEQMWLDG